MALNTRLMGAWKTRVSTISRSPRVVSFSPCSFNSELLPAFCTAMFFLLSLHFLQQQVEALKVLFQSLSITFQPFSGFNNWAHLDSARPPLRVLSLRDQSRSLQNLKVSRDGGLGHRKRLGQFQNRRFTRSESRQNGTSGRVGKGRKRCVKLFQSVHNFNVI